MARRLLGLLGDPAVRLVLLAWRAVHLVPMRDGPVTRAHALTDLDVLLCTRCRLVPGRG